MSAGAGAASRAQDSADTWVLNGARGSLAFMLAAKGYDVWLTNSRGNKYSSGVRKYPARSDPYWKWTWDEMARFDLPSMLSYVRGASRVSHVPLVCHSQGCTQTVASLVADYPGVRASLRTVVALAPVMYLAHTASPLIKALAEVHADVLLRFLGQKEFLAEGAFLKWLLPSVCKATPDLCTSIIWLLVGDDRQHLNSTRLPVYLSHFPAGTSTWNMVHWAQSARHNVYARCDYGGPENRARYNSSTPPAYDLTLFPKTTNLVVFAGSKDNLCDPADLAHGLGLVPGSVKYTALPTYGHLDFVWGNSSYLDVYPDVIKAVDESFA